MRASADCKIQPSLACEIDGRYHVARIGGAHDDLRALVDHSVADLARLFIALVIGGDDVAPDLLTKLVECECDHVVLPSVAKAAGHPAGLLWLRPQSMPSLPLWAVDLAEGDAAILPAMSTSERLGRFFGIAKGGS